MKTQKPSQTQPQPQPQTPRLFEGGRKRRLAAIQDLLELLEEGVE